MKKLLTLVLALVMAFAIAAPALALGGEPITVVDDNKNIDLAITLYSGKLASNSDLEKYTPWTQNVLKDQEVTIVVSATKKSTGDAVVVGSTLNFEALGLKEKAEYVANPAKATLNTVEFADSTKKTTVKLATSAEMNVFEKDKSVKFFITGTVSGALSATASLGFNGPLTDVKSKKDGVSITIGQPDSNGYGYTAAIKHAGTAKELEIAVGANGAVQTIKWGTAGSLAPLAYSLVSGTSVGTMKWQTTPGTALPAAEQTALDEIFAQFGFKWENLSGYTLPASYIYAQVAGATKSVSLPGSALYTASLTVSDPTTVPATGDMSVVGIALAIVALAAAGFVVAKKVRA